MYRLFDGTTRVSTAVELKDGSILMVYPRKENFADTALWKWVMEHEAEYVDSSLTLSTHKTKLSAAPSAPAASAAPSAPAPLSPQDVARLANANAVAETSYAAIRKNMRNLAALGRPLPRVEVDEAKRAAALASIPPPPSSKKRGCGPEPLSPYTPPKEPIAAPDPMRLGPSAEGTPYRIRVTPPVSPRAEFQEPVSSTPPPRPSGLWPVASSLGPSASVAPAPYDPSKLGPSAEALGFDPDEKTRIYLDLTDIHQDLASLSRTMNERFALMDTRIKALLKKLD